MTIDIPKKVLDQEFKDKFTAMIELTKRYSYNGETPMVSITDDGATIYIEDSTISDVNDKVRTAFDICNQGKFAEAKRMLQQIVKECPIHFDAYRGLAQIAFMNGDMDEALDHAITSIHLNPNSIYTLILVGNILTRKEDYQAAAKYYEMAYDIEPEDFLTINNVGANALYLGDFDKADKFLKLAVEKSPSNLNSYIGLAEVEEHRGDSLKAFNYLIDGMKNHKEKIENPGVTEYCIKMMKDVAEKSSQNIDEVQLVQRLIKELKEEGGLPIRCQEDNAMSLCGQLKYAPLYGTDYHTVLYNTKHSHYYYFIIHELIHLRFYINASKIGKNNIMISSDEDLETFKQKFGKYFSSKISDQDQYDKFMKQMFYSFGLQLMNCPLDLLVEDYIAKSYPEIAPVQYIVLTEQENANLEAYKNSKVTNTFPAELVRINKVLNIVTSLHYKEMYNIDHTTMYNATEEELEEASCLYNYYKGFTSKQHNPGDEYTLVTLFKELLDVPYLVKMISESLARDIYGSAFSAPNQNSEQAVDEANAEFRKNHTDDKNSAETQIMAQLMTEALDFFDGKPTEFIGKVAFEIAKVGVNGISPEKQGYKISSIDKNFTGFEFLAYYYVSWAIAYPDMLPKLGLPFDSAYQLALEIRRRK